MRTDLILPEAWPLLLELLEADFALKTPATGRGEGAVPAGGGTDAERAGSAPSPALSVLEPAVRDAEQGSPSGQLQNESRSAATTGGGTPGSGLPRWLEGVRQGQARRERLEAFRRQSQRDRAFGLPQRHATKLRAIRSGEAQRKESST